ncbi:uncharacterized protein LOC143667945 [Tamandua tetradactyla]|uniref:uncharacterized protein LOC143667945 n=1 Tax=Tamandua tetradactyla TaxID=48850 RepID=UPI004054980C
MFGFVIFERVLGFDVVSTEHSKCGVKLRYAVWPNWIKCLNLYDWSPYKERILKCNQKKKQEAIARGSWTGERGWEICDGGLTLPDFTDLRRRHGLPNILILGFMVQGEDI